jgi:hypothetical protein
VQGWTVVREDQKEAGVGLLKRLVQQEGLLPEVTLMVERRALQKLWKVKQGNRHFIDMQIFEQFQRRIEHH